MLKKLIKIGLVVYLSAFILTVFLVRNEIASYYERFVYFSFCEKPIPYKIGFIDPKFGVTEEELLNTTKKAADIWNNARTQPLFVYDQNGYLTVNLVFDERQSLVREISTSKHVLENEGTTLDQQITYYETRLAQLEQQVEELNNEIEYWNNEGGAPPDKYRELTNNQRAIQNEIREVNELANELNQETVEYNTKVEDLNQTVGRFNNLLGIKPEEGLYIPVSNRIEVYIYDDESKLIHTMAHEFGHALGLDHVEEEAAIMYGTSSSTTILSPKDLDQLHTFCQERSRIELLKNDALQLIQLITSEKTY